MSETIDFCSQTARLLTEEEILLLEKQNQGAVSEFKANKFKKEAKKHWDLFYKRNEDRFFRDRNWTLREFSELCGDDDSKKGWTLLEVGCGVGNFIFPLLREGIVKFIYACDLSSKAVEIVKQNENFSPDKLEVFQHDVSASRLSDVIPNRGINVASMIFVLSAITPSLHQFVFKNIHDVLENGGLLLFRDYGLYDMAQIRFGRDTKLAENHYLRHDGTQSYFFSIEYFTELAQKSGFLVDSCTYVHRRTINFKEGIDQPRIFLQAKLRKMQ